MLIAASAANTRALWYLTRGTGFVTLILLTGSVALGILQVSRWTNPRWPRFVTAGLHRNVSLLATVFLAVHIATSVVDGFAPIRWLDAVIPFASPYRPVWLGLGAVATDLLLAVIITSLLRARLSYGVWRAVHWATYACWPLAVVHGLGTGTDTPRGWALLVYVVCTMVVAVAVSWRLAHGWTSTVARYRLPAVAASLLFPVVTAAFVVLGPMRPGWARRAGTPTSLLASSRTAAAAAAQPAPAPSAPTTAPAATGFAAPFSDQVTGRLAQAGPDGSGRTTVTIDGTLSGSQPGALRVTLAGPAAEGGGIVMESSAATLGPPTQPALYQGRVVGLDGSVLELSLRDAAGARLRATVALRIEGSTVTGTLEAR